jgi:hypothetical protein
MHNIMIYKKWLVQAPGSRRTRTAAADRLRPADYEDL